MMRRLVWFADGVGAVLTWQHRERLAELTGLLPETPWFREGYDDDDDDDGDGIGLLPVADPAAVEPVYEILIKPSADREQVVAAVSRVIEDSPVLELRVDGSDLVVSGFSYDEVQAIADGLDLLGAITTIRPQRPARG